MSMLSMEYFDSSSLETWRLDLTAKVTTLNESFASRVAATDGFYGKIEGMSQIIKEQTGWADEIIDAIRSPEEFKIYKDAGLVEAEVGGKKCLLKTDIDWTQVDDFGRTNAERIQNGYNPISKDGQTIEYHHIGQKADSPLAELPTSEHRGKGNDTVLHDKNKPTEVHGEDNTWSTDKKEFLANRSEAVITQRSAFSRAVGAGHETGVQSGLAAASITAAISTVENVRSVISGEITAQDAFANIAKDSGTALAVGYGTGFISGTVANATMQSGHALIRTLGNANVTAAVISFGIDSYDSVVSYAQGEINGQQLAYDLGESASGVAGAMAGAQFGAAIGTVAGPVGTVAGGLVGGMVGYAVATGAYATAIEVAQGGTAVLVDKAEGIAEFATEAYAVVREVTVEGAQVVGTIAVNVANAATDTFEVTSTTVIKNVDALKDKAVEMGKGVLGLVASTTPEAVDSVRTAMNEFASNLGVLFNL